MRICLPDETFRDDLLAAVPGVEAIAWDGHENAPDGLDAVDVVVPPYPSANWTERQFEQFGRAAVLQVLSAGFEQWLPITPARMTICNGRGIHGGSTAELAVLGLLAHWRHLPTFLRNQQTSTWKPVAGEGAEGKRVLVVGAGDIGEQLKRRLSALGAETTLVGRHARDGVEAISDLPALCRRHDAVVVAVPLSDETHHLVDADLLRELPDGAVVVNVARGPVVDTDALLAELTAGRLRAFLDVVEPEPLPSDHPLWSAPNVVITPHVGGGSEGWRHRAQALIEKQVRHFLNGEPLENVVRESAEKA